MDLHPIALRIREQVPAIAKVGLAGDFQTAQANLRIQMPAAFVVPAAERAAPNEYVRGVLQRVSLRFSVVFAIQNVRDMQGDAAQTDLDQVRSGVMAGLLGWQPDGADSPITYGGGRLVRWADGILWWMDDFDTTYYVRAL